MEQMMNRSGDSIIIRTVLLVLFSCFLVLDSAWSQVVTPPMDITDAPDMPGAVGWMEGIRGGGLYLERGQERVSNGETIFDTNVSGFQGNLAFAVGNANVVASYYEDSSKVSLGYNYEESIHISTSDTIVSAAITGGEFTTIGLGVRTIVSDDYVSRENPLEKTTENRTIGGISFVFFESLYFGGGVERVNQSSTYTVDNDWTNVVTGTAYQIGEPGGAQFRLEYSFRYSPESVKDANNDELESAHYKTTTSRLNLDLMFSGLLFAISGLDRRINAQPEHPTTGKAIEEIKQTRNQFSVLWIPQEGLSLGFAFAKIEEKNTFQEKGDEFQIKGGFVF